MGRLLIFRFNRAAQAILVPALVCLDLIAKTWAQAAEATTQGPTSILPFLSLVLAYNPGLTFGNLFGLARHPFITALLSASIIAALLVWIWRETNILRRFLIAFALAGALGNAIDRSINSMVTDFLQIHFGGSSIFVVNFADIFIVIGVFGLVVTTKASKSGRTPK
jgi:signal peptidase II